MKYRILFSEKLLNFLYESVFISLILIFFNMVFLKQDSGILEIISIVLCIGLSYFIRDYSKNNIFVLVFHILEMAIFALIPVSIQLKILLAVLIFIYLIPTSFAYIHRHYRLKPIKDVPWPSVFTAVIVYLYGVGLKSNFLMNFAYLAVVLMLMIYLFTLYCDDILKYMEQNTNVSGLPLKEILSVNSRIVIFIVILMTVVMISGRFINFSKVYETLYSAAKSAIGLIVTFFMLFFKLLSSIISTGTYETDGTGEAQQTESIPLNQETESFLEIILGIFVVLLILFVLYKISARIVKLVFTTKNFEKDIITDAVVEKKGPNGSRLDGLKRRIFLTKEERARNIYKKTIRAHKDDICLTGRLTCQDIRQDIYDKNVGDVDDLTALYEEIRYGKASVDDDIIKKMTRFSKKDRRINSM